MKKRMWLPVCLALVLAFLLTGTAAQAEKTIKVGIVDTYTGPPSTYTNDVRDAFKLATDKINAKGGILGKKIEFVTRDDKFKVDIGLSAAKELIMRENVDILMGTINSGLTLAISDLCEKEKIPFLVTFAKSEKITGEKGNRYVFSMNENTAIAERPGLPDWQKNLIKNTGLPAMITNMVTQSRTASGTILKHSSRMSSFLASHGGR